MARHSDTKQKPFVHFKTREGLSQINIEIELYSQTIDVLVADKGDDNKIEQWFKRHDIQFEPLNNDFATYMQISSRKDEWQKTGIILLRRGFKPDTQYMLTIVHECLHAISDILRRIGIEHTRETEEAYAYLHEWTVNKIVLGLMKKPVSYTFS